MNIQELYNSIRVTVISIAATITGDVTPTISYEIKSYAFDQITPYFQIAAWIVGIVAGIISILNGLKSLKKRKR